MTLAELREACAKVADEHCLPGTADAIRAIPLPAPVDDEFAGHTPGPGFAEFDAERRTLKTSTAPQPPPSP